MKQLCYISVTFWSIWYKSGTSMTLPHHDSPQLCTKNFI